MVSLNILIASKLKSKSNESRKKELLTWWWLTTIQFKLLPLHPQLVEKWHSCHSKNHANTLPCKNQNQIYYMLGDNEHQTTSWRKLALTLFHKMKNKDQIQQTWLLYKDLLKGVSTLISRPSFLAFLFWQIWPTAYMFLHHLLEDDKDYKELSKLSVLHCVTGHHPYAQTQAYRVVGLEWKPLHYSYNHVAPLYHASPFQSHC